LKKGDVKEQYQVTEDSGDINGAWDSVRENIKISAQESLRFCESKHHNPWFEEESSKIELIERSMLNYCGCRTQVK
jgi:hypothetical protein